MEKRTFSIFLFYGLIGVLFMSLTITAGQVQAACGETTETVLMAGQNIPAGSVVVKNDEQFLYVTFLSDDGWTISETHLAVATSPEDLPQTRKGNPVPGRFDYKAIHFAGVTEVTHSINLDTWALGTQLYIAAHSVVISGSVSETAWGEGIDFPGDNWGMYFEYEVQSCSPPLIDSGVIEFATPYAGIFEREQSLIVGLVRNGSSDGEAQVILAYEDISAIQGDDYIAPFTTVTFSDGETEKGVEIIILPDEMLEDNELFSIRIVDVVNAEIGPQSDMTCTIIDNYINPPSPPGDFE